VSTNTSANPLAAGLYAVEAHSVFGTCRKTERMSGSQIKDHCHEWSSWEHQIKK